MNVRLRDVSRYARVIKICAAVLLPVMGTIVTGYSPAVAAEVKVDKPNFTIRDGTRFRGNPNLSKYGLNNVVVAYEGELWSNRANKNEPDLKHIKSNYIPKLRRQNPDVLVIDIERWPLDAKTTVAERTATINKLKKVINLVRSEMPRLKIGMYMLMPERNYLAPTGDPKKSASRTTKWRERNLQLMPLADAVDIIFPSLYTFEENVDKWNKYAIANLEAAKVYGKPVWPFLWMKYRDGKTDIPAAFWRNQLEVVYQHADGAVLWSMASSRIKFDATAPWFRETSSFLKAKKIVK